MIKSEFDGWPLLQESQHDDKIIENTNFFIDLLIKLHLHHLNPFFALRPINVELDYDIDDKNVLIVYLMSFLFLKINSDSFYLVE